MTCSTTKMLKIRSLIESVYCYLVLMEFNQIVSKCPNKLVSGWLMVTAATHD